MIENSYSSIYVVSFIFLQGGPYHDVLHSVLMGKISFHVLCFCICWNVPVFSEPLRGMCLKSCFPDLSVQTSWRVAGRSPVWGLWPLFVCLMDYCIVCYVLLFAAWSLYVIASLLPKYMTIIVTSFGWVFIPEIKLLEGPSWTLTSTPEGFIPFLKRRIR